MRWSPRIQHQLDRLQSTADKLGWVLVCANQGFSVKVIDKRTGEGHSLEKLVSLHNQGAASYAARSLTKEQRRRINTRVSWVEVQLQRSGGILVTPGMDILERLERIHERRLAMRQMGLLKSD